MDFSVPQFIEREPKLIGPFTLRQFIFVGVAGGIALFLYFTVQFVYFILIAPVLAAGVLSLAFLKINGIPLPTVIKNFLFFTVAPRIYMWKKTDIPVYRKAVDKKIAKVKGEKPEESILRIENKSGLKKLRSNIELNV